MVTERHCADRGRYRSSQRRPVTVPPRCGGVVMRFERTGIVQRGVLLSDLENGSAQKAIWLLR